MVSADRLTPTSTASSIQSTSLIYDYMDYDHNIDEHVVQNEMNSRFSYVHWRPHRFFDIEEDNFFIQRFIRFSSHFQIEESPQLYHPLQDSNEDLYTTDYRRTHRATRAFRLIDFDSAFGSLLMFNQILEPKTTPKKSIQQFKYDYFVKKQLRKYEASGFKLMNMELIKFHKNKEKIEQNNYLMSPRISIKEDKMTKFQIMARTSSSM